MSTRRQFLIGTAVAPWLMISAHAAQTGPFRAIRGRVHVNGRPASLSSLIGPNDRIEVQDGGSAEFVVGEDAYLLRGASMLEMQGDGGVVGVLRLVTGALLGVFGKRQGNATQIVTETATIGIRGTAVYTETQPRRVYTCTCYGHTELVTGNESEAIASTHHNGRLIVGTAGHLNKHRAAVHGHGDRELWRLEAYVGRKPAFDP